MPKKCSICVNEHRQEIDESLLGSETFFQISKRYGVSNHSLRNHKDHHLPSSLVKAHEFREVARADSLLDKLRGLQQKAMDLLNKAEASGDLRAALQGIREARGCLELLAKLSGDLAQEGTVQIQQVISLGSAEISVALETLLLHGVIALPEGRYPELEGDGGDGEASG